MDVLAQWAVMINAKVVLEAVQVVLQIVMSLVSVIVILVKIVKLDVLLVMRVQLDVMVVVKQNVMPVQAVIAV